MDEADRLDFSEIAEDCSRVLEPGATMHHDAREDVGDRVRLTARFELDVKVQVSAATGETVVDVHAHLRETLLVDRIRIGFTEIVTSH